MPRTVCPTNYLAAYENFQVAKYRLRRTEDELLKAFEVTTIADLEMAMLRERSKSQPRFLTLTSLYQQQHRDLGAADEAFEIASNLQRAHIAKMQATNSPIAFE